MKGLTHYLFGTFIFWLPKRYDRFEHVFGWAYLVDRFDTKCARLDAALTSVKEIV
jgi:hypothetical protein